MWKLDYKESWVPKNWCFWTVVLEKTLKSPLDCKEIQPVHPKGNQPWIFIGRTNAKAETLILWPPDAKNWLTGKDPDAGKDWRQEEKGTTEDEMVVWHHWFDGHEFEQAPGVGDGQGSLACCSLWGLKELDTTEWMNWLFECLGASQVVLVVKNPPANARIIRDSGLTPGLGRSPGGRHDSPLQYSCLENPMDRATWWTIVHSVAHRVRHNWNDLACMHWGSSMYQTHGTSLV